MISSCPDGNQVLRICTKQSSRNLDGTYAQIGYWKTQGNSCESTNSIQQTPESITPEVQSDVVVAESEDNNMLYMIISGLTVALCCGGFMVLLRSHTSHEQKPFPVVPQTNVVAAPTTKLEIKTSPSEMPTFT